MAELAETVRAIQLDWTVEDGVVTVTPRDEDRFTIRLRTAIEILHRADKELQFQGQFTLLLKQLAGWLRDRADLRDAYVTVRDGSLAFVVVRKSCEYEAKFEDELSELDVQIANDPDLSLINLHAMALPDVSESALSSFLDTRFTLCYSHGSGTGPHRTGEQEPQSA